jgi:predicted Zn-dependent protease
MIAIVGLYCIAGISTSKAKSGLSIIRDAEIEDILYQYSAPLLASTGIPPRALRIRLVKDNSLNAFVTTGMNMYINTGLLVRAETANQVIGVMAHETGHIAGGHMVRMRNELQGLQTVSLLSTIVGVAAGALSGHGEIAGAIISGSQGSALKTLFSFSRTQESSADAFATRALDATGQSARGLLQFFEILKQQEALLGTQQDPYLRTHPLTKDRIIALEHHVQNSAYSSATEPDSFKIAHARTRAKLYAFFNPLRRTLNKYPDTDTSLPARYARAIAYYRQGLLSDALPIINSLIADFPTDPFFEELKGQMFFENGRIADAIPAYEQAIEKYKVLATGRNIALLYQAYAHTLVESGTPKHAATAENLLRRALQDNPHSAFNWQLLARAYTIQAKKGEAQYATAEFSLRTGQAPKAMYHAKMAMKELTEGSSLWLRASDIVNYVEQARKNAVE